MSEKTLTLGGQEVQLTLPKSIAVRYDVLSAAGNNAPRAFSAALGLAWKGKGRPKARYDQCGYSPLLYGGRVMDELVARGMTPSEIVAAGVLAFNLLTDGLIDEKEVTGAEGNSEAPEPSTT